MQKMLRLAQAGIAILIIFLTALSAHTSRYDTPFTITFLNVGPINHAPEGEAILLRTSDGKTALIDGGLDATSLGQQLDARLPSWQRSLDTLILTSPRADHIDGLLDILSRYSVNSVFDAGMLHPSTTYARWRRTISKRNVAYHTVVQGYTIPLGNAVSLQVLWPTTHLHTGSNETRDNGLVLRLQAPGLTLLLVGATAQSTYALEGLLSLSPISLLHANIVQIMGDPGKTSSDKLALLLQRAHPSLLIVTPAQVRTQHKNTKPSSGSQFLAYTIPIQMKVLQTQQIGTLEVSSTLAGWHISNTH